MKIQGYISQDNYKNKYTKQPINLVNNMLDLDIFTEQAEYLSNKSFDKWTISHHEEATILKKLTQGGAKLITGPRGCGKTTLMLKAYNHLKPKKNKSLAVYVNFKSSLKLEPLYRNNTNAAYWFNQWLLIKVIQGLLESLSSYDINYIDSNYTATLIEKNVSLLEMGRVDLLDDEEDQLTKSKVEHIINKALEITNNTRCVLLLDDAGHAFSPEQQHDFFEFFREIKTKTISPKAAIYPGVTSYSSSFHVGHDADEIDVWIKPNSSGYLDFMHSLLKSRLGDHLYGELSQDKILLDLMCFAAYGIPRSLLNMISTFCKEDEKQIEPMSIKLESQSVMKVIKSNFDKTYQIYDSLKFKIPMYTNFIDLGSTFYENCLIINKEFNKGSSEKKQSSIIAIKRPLSSELSKVIGFFQYAGLMAPQGISSRGGKGVYELFELHYGAIIDRNVFFSSRGISAENYTIAFRNRPNHHYPRHSESSLIKSESASDVFTLALPPCEICKTPRISDESKFCANCGAKLKDASIFENLVSQDIKRLPITSARARSIKEHSKIKTIKDILMDHDNKQLRSVHMIGAYWAQKIRSYAEEYIA